MNTMAAWNPFSGGTTLQDQLNRIFEAGFGRRSDSHSELAAWAPAVDICETESELVLKADLPDMQEHDIDLRIEKNMLTLRGERKFDSEVGEDKYLRVERAYGAFTRSFSLPSSVNADAVRAEYKNGVLTVRIPKREQSKPKQIKIEAPINAR